MVGESEGRGKVCRDWSVVAPHFGLREPCLSEKDSPITLSKSILSDTIWYLYFRVDLLHHIHTFSNSLP